MIIFFFFFKFIYNHPQSYLILYMFLFFLFIYLFIYLSLSLHSFLFNRFPLPNSFLFSLFISVSPLSYKSYLQSLLYPILFLIFSQSQIPSQPSIKKKKKNLFSSSISLGLQFSSSLKLYLLSDSSLLLSLCYDQLQECFYLCKYLFEKCLTQSLLLSCRVNSVELLNSYQPNLGFRQNSPKATQNGRNRPKWSKIFSEVEQWGFSFRFIFWYEKFCSFRVKRNKIYNIGLIN